MIKHHFFSSIRIQGKTIRNKQKKVIVKQLYHIISIGQSYSNKMIPVHFHFKLITIIFIL